MEITYKMIGGDGAHYGPVSLDQLKAWLGEGRITPETKILRSDTQSWLSASQYVELNIQADTAPVAPPPLRAASLAPASVPRVNPILERRVKQSANWFYWIAVLSLVNSFMAISGSPGGFLAGLAISQIIDVFALKMDSGAAIALGINIVAAGIFVLFGYFAGMRHSWSFIVGMILYAMDALLCLLIHYWFGLGFHVFALFCIFKGLQANQLLDRENR